MAKQIHVHALREYPPKLSISQIANALKGVSSGRYGQAGNEKPHAYALWSPSYFAVSVGGAPIEVLKRYIQEQSRSLMGGACIPLISVTMTSISVLRKLFTRRLTPWKITALYALVGGLWVLFSDKLLGVLVTNPEILTQLQTIKGWLYPSSVTFREIR